jgi:hypothetical protein
MELNEKKVASESGSAIDSTRWPAECTSAVSANPVAKIRIIVKPP